MAECTIKKNFSYSNSDIDHVRAKAWSTKNPGKVAMASSFKIVHRKSKGKSIKLSITKTFPEWPSSPWNKYVMYFYQE